MKPITRALVAECSWGQERTEKYLGHISLTEVPEMKIEITMPEIYKNYMIVGVAIKAPRLKGWKLKGIIYSKSGKELKQLD